MNAREWTMRMLTEQGYVAPKGNIADLVKYNQMICRIEKIAGQRYSLTHQKISSWDMADDFGLGSKSFYGIIADIICESGLTHWVPEYLTE